MTRQKYPTRKILLRAPQQVEVAISAIRNAPLDQSKPLELLIREEVKARKPDQNSLMWAGPLKDIAEQGYVNGRTYRPEIWHHHLKELFLPEEYDPELCKREDYRKWDYTPGGERILVGSTTDLTVRGFSLYLTQVEAYAATELGVVFHVRAAA